MQPETLGTESPIEIADVSADLLLPRLPGQTTPPALEARWPLLPPVGAHLDWLSPDTSQIEWGEIAEFSSRVSFLRAAVVRTSIPVGNEDLASKMAPAVFDWVEIFCDWLAAFAGLAFLPDGAVRAYGTFALRTGASGGEIANIGTAAFVGPPLILRPLGIERAIGPEQWKRSAAAASRAEKVATEHHLLNQARERLHESNWREAVIAAGSAAEIALSGGLLRRLTERNEPAVLEILLDVDGFGRLRTLASKLGVACPPQRETDKMSRIRNGAIHEGVTPSWAEAHHAVDVAARIVAMHSPL